MSSAIERRLRLMRGGGFDPASLSPALWLKADGTLWQDSARTTAATADGDPVGAWDDASGNGRHVTQATAAARATLKLAIQNGKPVVRFDGVDDFLATATFTLNQPTSVFIVAQTRPGSSGDSRMFDGFGVNGGTVYQQNPLHWWMFAGVQGPRSSFVEDTWNSWMFEFNAANSKMWRDGSQLDITRDAGTNNMSGFTLAALGGGGFTGTIDVGEVIVYPSVLSSADRESVEGYLRTRWGTP